jgi:hypothetical protein
MHEANLVFNIGMELVGYGVPFELEWSSPVGRVDMAIKDENRLYGIIEAKQKPTEGTFQLARYNSLGVPVLVVHWGIDVRDVRLSAEAWLEKDGVPLDGIENKEGLIKKYRKPRKKIQEWDEDLNIRI